MTFTRTLLIASFTILVGCGTQVASDNPSLISGDGGTGGASCNNTPTDYACPNGSCPDKTACNWCGCGSAWGGDEWSCNLRGCSNDGGVGNCAVDGDCTDGNVCRFLAGCEGIQSGRCSPPTYNFYPLSCVPMSPRLTRACLCDNTQKEILLDCSGVHEAFKNLGDCE